MNETANQTAVSIDFGGSHVECGLVQESRVLASKTIPIECARLAQALPKVEETVLRLVQTCDGGMSTISGVAVGICAIVGKGNTVTAANGKYDDAIGFSFSTWSKDTFGLRCAIENDTRLALLGEHFAGAAHGFEDAVLVTLGTGIGGAVLLGGRLLRSIGHKAGGLAGHLGVDWKGRMCSCGNRGCAEAEASTAFLDEICRERASFSSSSLAKQNTRVDFRQLFRAVDEQDRLAVEVLDHCIGVWSALAVSLIHAYDPQVLVFGGGVMHRHEDILPKLREYVDQHAWAARGSIRIVPTRLGSSAALLGALPLLRGEA